MLSQMEETEQSRLRACGLDYIGLLIANHYKSKLFHTQLSCSWMLINTICARVSSTSHHVISVNDA